MKDRIVFFERKWIEKSIILFFLILFSGCTTLNKTDKVNYEKKIEIADAAFNNADYLKAFNEYENLLEEVKYRNKYVRAVLLFRIASVQKETGDIEGLKKTIARLENFNSQKLPYYYNKKIEELSKYSKQPDRSTVLDGAAVPEKTIIPKDKILYSVYISNNGNDNNEGTINLPLKTFEAAQKRIREKRKDTALNEGSLQIVFIDNYDIEKPLTLTIEDSGTERNPFVISGNVEKKTVISGGKNIPIWRKISPADTNAPMEEQLKNKVIVAEFEKNNIKNFGTLVLGGFSSGRGFNTFYIPELFYDGEVQKISSWPNEGYTKIEIGERFSNDRILKWVNEKEAWLHGYWKYEWADAYEKIEKIDIEKREIFLAPPLNIYGFENPQARIVNAVSEIDLPGEWAIDTKKGLIFYYAPENFNPKNIFLSYSPSAFKIDNCNNLKIESLEIKYIRGDIINITDAENIVIYNNNFNNVSGYGLIINGKKNHIIHSTVFKSFGRGGLSIINTGDRKNLVDSETIIENCRFSDLSRIDRTYAAGILVDGMNQIIRNNVFYNLPSSAIRLDTNSVIIEHNEFYNCVYESGDQGVVEAFQNPLLQGNIIRWNYFRDIVNDKYMAASVRLDDNISGFTIYENIFENGSSHSFGAIQINKGKNNLMEGNIFYNCNLVFSLQTRGIKYWQTDKHIINSFNAQDWKNEKWKTQYPYLDGMENKYISENYYIDNIIINSLEIWKGNYSNSILFNNKEITIDNKVTYSAILLYIPKYRKIPIEKIGNYKNN